MPLFKVSAHAGGVTTVPSTVCLYSLLLGSPPPLSSSADSRTALSPTAALVRSGTARRLTRAPVCPTPPGRSRRRRAVFEHSRLTRSGASCARSDPEPSRWERSRIGVSGPGWVNCNRRRSAQRVGVARCRIWNGGNAATGPRA